MDDAPLDLLAESVLEAVWVPACHGTEAELLCEDGVHALKAEIVALDLNSGLCAVGSVNDSSDQSALIFENLGVFNLIWESNKKEFVVLIETAVDDMFQNGDDVGGFGPDVFTVIQELLNAQANSSLSLDFQLNEVVHLKGDVSLLDKSI